MNLPHHASGERDHIAMRTLTAVRPYLAAAFLLVISLVAYGCGDSATVSEPATLGNLSASTGELQPPFAPETTDYTVRLSSDVSSTTITASPRVAGDSIQFDNEQTTSRTITLASPGDEKPITIVVADTGAGGASKSYRVTVKRDKEDTSLSALSVSEGSLAPPLFDKNIRDYTVNNVGPSVTKVIISATKSNQNTVMQIDGPSGSVTVPAGALSGQATVQLGGTGSDTKVSIVVTATGGSPNTYTVTINRGPSNDNFLKGLSIPPGKLDFKVTSFVYNVTVLSNVDNVTVTATPRDPTASITINGSNTNSQLINVPVPGAPPVQITIRVTAQNGESKNYTINVKRAALNGNNDLKSLSISPGKLDFKASDTLYDVNVSSGVQKVTLSATPQVSTASVAILVNGAGTNSQPITLLDPGLTTNIKVRVTAQNSTSKDYDINVKRAPLGGNFNLKSLTVSPGNLDFDADDLTYDVSLLSNVTNVTITAAPQDPNAKSVTINGQPSPNTINLGAPGPETRITIPIIVTAQNNETRKYEVTVIRAALGGNFNLKSLTVTSHTLSPPFTETRARTDYDLSVINSVGSITVNATPQDTGASVRILVNGAASTNPISLPLGPSTTEIEIFVKAPNGTEKPYSITVDRAAASSNDNLSALSVNGSSVPSFTQGTLGYTVNVASGVNEVTVSATKADSNATMAVGSVTVPPGTPTGQTTVPVSASPISIAVTAPGGGAPRTYTVTVRQGPPAPTVAPDLIDADDPYICIPASPNVCDPTKSDATTKDNVTTVMTPRFSIPPPDAGETAKLYKNGVEEPSSFNPGDNTLRPNNPLPEGDFDITYTLSNSGGESGPSPVMTPQLRILATPPPPPSGGGE